MNRKGIFSILILIIAAYFIGKLSTGRLVYKSEDASLLKVVGDVKEIVTLKNLGSELNKETINIEDRKAEGINLDDIIAASEPLAGSNNIVLVNIDGLATKIEPVNLKQAYITFSKDHGWEFLSKSDPTISGVKNLKEIIVVSNEADRLDIGMNIIDSGRNIRNLTVGEALYNTSTSPLYLDEELAEIKDNKNYNVRLHTQNRTFKLEDILEEDIDIQGAIVMGETGSYMAFDSNGYFEVRENHIDYLVEDNKEKVEKVKGVILNPPPNSNMDGYYDTANYLKNDEDVLFIFIDGFAYHQYEYALEKNLIPFLASKEKAKKATTVYRPVTNAGFAAMITGKPPIENGVYSRAQRQLKVDSIFKLAKDLNKKSILIEGDIAILDTEIPPVLNLDRDGDGNTDNEVFESAMDAIGKDYNFVFVHFHGVDDQGHTYGDLAKETMDTISKNDQYVARLVENWKGKVIVTADHGMHSTKDAGNHGEFRYEDLIIPYMVFTGGGELE